MRTTRAFIAGFGTTGSLVAAAACAALIASAVIAFNGWSGAGIGNRVDDLFVDDSAPIVYDLPGPQVIAADAGAAAAVVTAAPAGPAFVVPAGLGPGGTNTFGNGTIPSGVPVTIGPGGIAIPTGRSGVGSGGGGGVGGELPGLPDTSGITDGLGDTVTGAGQGLGNTVSQVNPQLGQTVAGAGQGLGNTVSQAGSGVGGLLGGKK